MWVAFSPKTHFLGSLETTPSWPSIFHWSSSQSCIRFHRLGVSGTPGTSTTRGKFRGGNDYMEAHRHDRMHIAIHYVYYNRRFVDVAVSLVVLLVFE